MRKRKRYFQPKFLLSKEKLKDLKQPLKINMKIITNI